MVQLQVEEKTVICHLFQNTSSMKALRTSSKQAKGSPSSHNLELSWEFTSSFLIINTHLIKKKLLQVKRKNPPRVVKHNFQKTTKRQEMDLGEVSLCISSKLHLFLSVHFCLQPETLAGHLQTNNVYFHTISV